MPDDSARTISSINVGVGGVGAPGDAHINLREGDTPETIIDRVSMVLLEDLIKELEGMTKPQLAYINPRTLAGEIEELTTGDAEKIAEAKARVSDEMVAQARQEDEAEHAADMRMYETAQKLAEQCRTHLEALRTVKTPAA
ncbi:MAG: hypothetical protein WC518_00860 [Patescibacteria group bacterium]